MLGVSVSSFSNSKEMAFPYLENCNRLYNSDGRGGCWSDFGKEKNYMGAAKTGNYAFTKMKMRDVSPVEQSCISSKANLYKEILEAARDKYAQEISFQSKDKDISLAKILLFFLAPLSKLLEFSK